VNLASRLCAAAPASSMLASAAYISRLQRGGSGRGVKCFAHGWVLLKGLGHTETFRVWCSEETRPDGAAPARGEETAAVDGATDGGGDGVEGTGESKPAKDHKINVAEAASEAPAHHASEEGEHLEFERKYEEQSRGRKRRGLLVSLALHLEGVLMQRSVVLTSMDAVKSSRSEQVGASEHGSMLTSMDAVKFHGPDAQGAAQGQQHNIANRALLEPFLQTSVLLHLAAVLGVLVVIWGGSRFSGTMRGCTCALAAMRVAFVLSSLFASAWGGRGLRNWFATFPSLLSVSSFFFLTGSYRDFKMLFPLAAALSVSVLILSNMSPPQVCVNCLLVARTPHPSPLTPHPLPLTPLFSPLTLHPSAFDPQPSDLDPRPSPLNPQPSTLGSQPSTLSVNPDAINS
jgi:hypothetical protein